MVSQNGPLRLDDKTYYSSHIISSRDATDLIEFKPRRAWEQIIIGPIAYITEKIRFNLGPAKEQFINFGIIKPRHRAAVQSQRPRRHHQICALQCAVPKCRCFNQFIIPDKPGPGIGMGK